MENLQVATHEFPARINLGRRRTGAPRVANDNGAFVRAVPRAIAGESIVVDAVAAADSVLRAKAKTIAVPAPRRHGLAAALADWFTIYAARRAILHFGAMPDHRLARIGMTRAEIETRMRECFGLPLPGGPRAE